MLFGGLRAKGMVKTMNKIKNCSFAKEFVKNKALFLMLLPGTLLLIMFSYLPMGGVTIAFKQINYGLGLWNSPWVGLSNFKFLFSTEDWFIITRNTLLYNVSWLFAGLFLAVAIAIGLSQIKQKRMCKFYQSVMILPYIMNAWYVLIMRTFFITAIPAALIESAKLEGASEGIIFAKIVMPLSLPGLATIGLFAVLQYWNDWWLPLMLTTRRELSNLQFLLQSMISNIEMLTQNSEYVSSSISQLANMPKEGARMALCVISIGPLVLAYPFFQKYFVSGLTVGAVKE